MWFGVYTMMTCPFPMPVRLSPRARRLTSGNICAGESEMEGSAESIHIGEVLGGHSDGKR